MIFLIALLVIFVTLILLVAIASVMMAIGIIRYFPYILLVAIALYIIVYFVNI